MVCLNVQRRFCRSIAARPHRRAILNGDDEAGVCIMRMEAGLDTGDYRICRSCQIAGMNAERLTGELADKGAYALLSALYDVDMAYSVGSSRLRKMLRASKIEKAS